MSLTTHQTGALVLLASSGCFLFQDNRPYSMRGTDAERTLYSAIDYCYSLGGGDNPAEVKESFDHYRRRVDEAVRLDPAVKQTTMTFHGISSEEAANPAIANRTLWQWTGACDARFKRLFDNRTANANEEAQARERLTGDRKKLYEMDGWPTETSSESNKWDEIIRSKWWSYGSLPNDDGEFRCFRKFYFDGDKVVRKSTDGLCR
jgi:hypothetical protein